MGGAIARGLIAASTPECSYEITISNPTASKLDAFAALGAKTTTSNVEAVSGCPDIVILCVKPWFIEKVIKEIKPHLCYETTEVSSVAAGISISMLSEWLAKTDAAPALPHLCIDVPNTAVSLRQSMTFQVNGQSPCPKCFEVFSQLGRTMLIEEKQLAAATSLASCGIAYAMRYVRAAMEGGVELGIKAALGQEIVAQTLVGAAELLMQPGAHPEPEIDKVTTPGGLTIRGLNAMEDAGFTASVIAGLRASTL